MVHRHQLAGRQVLAPATRPPRPLGSGLRDFPQVDEHHTISHYVAMLGHPYTMSASEEAGSWKSGKGSCEDLIVLYQMRTRGERAEKFKNFVWMSFMDVSWAEKVTGKCPSGI